MARQIPWGFSRENRARLAPTTYSPAPWTCALRQAKPRGMKDRTDSDPLRANPELMPVLERIASALERLAPAADARPNLDAADAFVWHAAGHILQPVPKVNRVDLVLLKGIDRVRDQLYDNTLRFAKGLPANNALLWGARGMGKSSLVKAIHAQINHERVAGSHALKLVEIHREDIESLPALMTIVRNSPQQFIVFCDDLSFDSDDTSYKSLKAVLEGGIEGRPDNVVFYATSNRRHLLPRDMMENERSTAINPHEAVEEKVSLSDRFGLWLPQMQPGRISRHGVGLRGAFRPRLSSRRDARRSARMGDHARRPLRPHRLAIYPGPRRQTGQADGLKRITTLYQRDTPRI
jgi:predicted AAA+ superfamily ATPase